MSRPDPRSTRPSRHAHAAGPGCVLALALALPLAPGAAAQQSLPEAIVRVDGRLSEAQVAGVRSFVDAGLEALTSADDVEALAEARQRLTAPLTAVGATPSFVQQYGRELAQRINALPQDTPTVQRVNALLLLRTAPIREALPVIRPALQTDDAAVRFTAAKVILDLLRAGGDGLQLGEQDRGALLDTLAEAASGEPDAFVVGKLLPGVQQLAGDAGRTRVIDLLNRRVEVHAANPGAGYLPELAAMSDLFLRNLGSFARADAAGLCRASARYLKLVSSQLAASALPAAEVPTARQLVTQSENILRELSTSQLGVPASALPGRIDTAVESGDFGSVSATADAWIEALGGSNTGISAESLAVPDPVVPGDAG
ncbi:hypothetical protein [Phycisphaera mikurensis]|uniref:Uncharacterized protein n=1 Tax=Phycisphaera mikurensis (strain NBRC 102666 / KCTC 22515 / FYK2301M01) TaxID=1142394 RepID=I0IE98_PHYMF|nr:hypothetical protein [Phycisphaera mikurensis]MBB6441389.1 hypothetical protein [Phycisphaera mikurensis]BAM03586.1 hypothetical protein PSMK_14270 [Phycisphaera mikurensis NBRC 102666]